MTSMIRHNNVWIREWYMYVTVDNNNARRITYMHRHLLLHHGHTRSVLCTFRCEVFSISPTQVPSSDWWILDDIFAFNFSIGSVNTLPLSAANSSPVSSNSSWGSSRSRVHSSSRSILPSEDSERRKHGSRFGKSRNQTDRNGTFKLTKHDFHHVHWCGK
jgi:hypothetical protein